MAKSKYDSYNREQLLDKIKQLEKQRYGLVWEDKLENVAEQCEQALPVLHEETSKEIFSDEKLPNNILIEGDNYHALYTLNFTHKRKVDVIYIDPPYNTGNKDFKYNDSFVEREDTFRHSKWVSFMYKRLRLAKNLLKENGVIIISIDDNEVSNLRMLCDIIFYEKNFIALLPTIMNLKGNQDQFGFAGTHEYTLVYAKNKSQTRIGEFEVDEIADWEEDNFGYWKKGANLKSTGTNAPREKRENLFYPIFITRNNKVYVTENNKKLHDSDVKLLPITDKKEMSWRWEKKKVKNEPHNIIVVRDGNEISIYKKQRPKLGDLPSKKPKSILYKPEYSSGNGTAQLKALFGEKAINNPKPLDLIEDLLFIGGDKNALILDFFAGSGTTGHAIMQLNQNDGGNRHFILCTNNENKICEEVTYPRIKKVIKGYNGNQGIPANLKYFKTDFVPQVITNNDKRVLVSRSTELLCIAENTFQPVKESRKKNEFAIFKSNKQITAIIYDEDAIEKCKVELEALNPKVKTVIYVFSYNHEYNAEDFEGLTIRFDVKPIPEAILNVYRKNAKLKRK